MTSSDSTVKGIYEKSGEMESSLVHKRAQVLILDLKIILIRFFCTRTKPTTLKQQPHSIIPPAHRMGGMQKKSVRTQGEGIMTKNLKCHRVAAVGKGGKGRKSHKGEKPSPCYFWALPRQIHGCKPRPSRESLPSDQHRAPGKGTLSLLCALRGGRVLCSSRLSFLKCNRTQSWTVKDHYRSWRFQVATGE